jgi:hypothetical protein
VTASVTRTGATTDALVVTLSSSDASQANVPATVNIGAGEASAAFAVNVLDNAVADGARMVTITATAGGYLPGADTLTVTDDDVRIVDDGDVPGYSESASGWFGVASAQYPGYGGDWRYHAAGSGTGVATWSATGQGAGRYEVLVTWAPFSNRASNAPFSVYDGVALEGVFPINQRLEPRADATVGGRPFQRLGTFNLSESPRVTLSNNADGYVIADAVQFVRRGELADELTLAVALNQASEGSGPVAASVTRSGPTGGALVVTLTSNDTSEATVPGTVTIPVGQTAAAFAVTIQNDAEADGTQTVTITATAADYFPGTDTLQVTDDESWTIDDEDPGYSETPVWVEREEAGYPGYAGTGDPSFGDWRYQAAGTGSRVATWEVTTNRPGVYEVYVTWAPFANRATNAPYTVYDGPASGGALEGTFPINQELTPTAHVTLGGRPFQRLGTSFTITSNTLAVTLSNLANEYVIADAVQFARIGDLPLRAAGGAAVGWDSVPTGEPLTTEQAWPLLAEAAARWQAASSPHAPREDIAGLAASVELAIADLPGDLLGLASSSAHTIWLDTDAAGYGWFVDATPWDDDEFDDEPAVAVANRMDALSVIFHELGHLQGLADVDALLHPDDPMADVLAAGVRGTSGPADVAAHHDAALAELLGD